ncbi:MAG: asparagine synthase (glutamine-hydrolyzing) [Ignavibacteria bacterium]|nr:asparagine synthase (glutamine-hydrolyzing) [Ignavibacteria bacterium]
MCGIAGVIDSSGKLNVNLLEKMSEVIKHRGPDDKGIYFDKETGIGLVHRRLSVIDLTSGHQPMESESGNSLIVFNGEIYNYRELREGLTKSGALFKTNSDTEVILNAYEMYDTESFDMLNGIFAFAIYDKRKRKLIIARDCFGVKPLYYSFTSGGITFGSEIKAILCNEDYKAELDYTAFNSFLTYRYNPSPQTLFKNIFKIKPGEILEYNLNGKYSFKKINNSNPSINYNIKEEEAIEEYSFLLKKAVERQMISDVPVGLFLSGGIDSAVIGYFMQGKSEAKISSFTIGFSGKGNYNELKDAEESSRFINSIHHGTELSKEEYLDFFGKSFYHLEEPAAETTIPALNYLSKLASKKVKVVLAGQGADEPLAGYKRYYGESKISKYRPLLNLIPVNLLSSVLPRNERIKRASYALNFSDELQRFLAIYTIFTPQQKEKLLNEDTYSKIKNEDIDLLKPWYSMTKNLDDSLSKILFIDTRMKLADDLLMFGDKMTMANSLEMRVPYLDKELVGFLETLPSSFKLRGNKHKYIHKKAAVKWLPKEIIDRKKRGFETPMDEWLQSSFADDAKKILNDRNSAGNNFFNLNFLNKMIDNHKSGRENNLRPIFAILSFEMWYKTFFENYTSAS